MQCIEADICTLTINSPKNITECRLWGVHVTKESNKAQMMPSKKHLPYQLIAFPSLSLMYY